MKEHHQIQSHTNALGGQGLRLTLQLGQMDDLNVCLISRLTIVASFINNRFPSVPGVARDEQWNCGYCWPRARC